MRVSLPPSRIPLASSIRALAKVHGDCETSIMAKLGAGWGPLQSSGLLAGSSFCSKSWSDQCLALCTVPSPRLVQC